MRRFAWMLGLVFFFLNPGFACGIGEPDFHYGAAEMRAAIEGTWSLTITPNAGTPSQVTILIQQDTKVPAVTAQSPGGSLVRAAHACGTRTLVKAAGACVDATEMPMVATFVEGDVAFAGMAGTGTFIVRSLVFSFGDLSLRFGEYEIASQISVEGVPLDPRLGPAGKAGTLVMTRIN